MTWETPEERDGLADNRERIWNRGHGIYEHGEMPMSIAKEYPEAHVVDQLRRTVAEKDGQFAALTAERDRLREAIAARDEYIKLLVDEVKEFGAFAFTHGIRSSRVEAGKQMRKRIADADEALAPQSPAEKLPGFKDIIGLFVDKEEDPPAAAKEGEPNP